MTRKQIELCADCKHGSIWHLDKGRIVDVDCDLMEGRSKQDQLSLLHGTSCLCYKKQILSTSR